MTEQGLLTAISLVLGFMGTVFASVMTYYMAKIQKQGVEAAVKVEAVAVKTEEVKEALGVNQNVTDSKLEDVAVKTEEVKEALVVNQKSTDATLGVIHTLVNSAMGTQLRLTAIALRRLADVTGNKEDAAAADVAETLLSEHLAKQTIVDDTTKKPVK